jgi:hypothetical protein
LEELPVEWVEEWIPKAEFVDNFLKNAKFRARQRGKAMHAAFLKAEMEKYPRRPRGDGNVVLSREWLEKHLGFPPLDL